MVILIPLVLVAAASVESSEWFPAKVVDGVQVEARSTPSGFDRHRGEVLVCADTSRLQAFMADVSHWHEWIPDVKEVRLLETEPESVTLYMETAVPWPFKTRDMVYRLTLAESSDDRERLRISIVGLPDYLPRAKDAYRMLEAAGEWRMTREGDRVRVIYELYVDPGRVPRFLANRRLAASVGKTLANLAALFPCKATDSAAAVPRAAGA